MKKVIGLRKLFRFGDLTFFDCAGVRLLLEKAQEGAQPGGCIYFRGADIALAVAELEKRGVVFTSKPGADAGGAQGIHAADMMLGSAAPET